MSAKPGVRAPSCEKKTCVNSVRLPKACARWYSRNAAPLRGGQHWRGDTKRIRMWSAPAAGASDDPIVYSTIDYGRRDRPRSRRPREKQGWRIRWSGSTDGNGRPSVLPDHLIGPREKQGGG